MDLGHIEGHQVVQNLNNLAEKYNVSHITVCCCRIDVVKREHCLKYLSLCIADPQKLDGCLEKFAAKLVLQGSTMKIFSSDELHRGLLNFQECQ